jgi:hypothetical protein
LTGLLLQRLRPRLGLAVLRRPGSDLLLERSELRLKVAVVGGTGLKRLGELDDLVLEAVGDLLEVRSGASFGLERLELLLRLTLTDARLEQDDSSAIDGVLLTNEGTAKESLKSAGGTVLDLLAESCSKMLTANDCKRKKGGQRSSL